MSLLQKDYRAAKKFRAAGETRNLLDIDQANHTGSQRRRGRVLSGTKRKGDYMQVSRTRSGKFKIVAG